MQILMLAMRVSGRTFSFWIGIAAAPILIAGTSSLPGWAPETKDLYHTAWTSESAVGAVTDIQQAPDGYLWLTTSKGISRFDGIRFQSLDEITGGAVRGVDIDSLFLTPSGGVWLSTRNAGLLFWKDGRLTTYTDRRCTPALKMGGMAEDRKGSLWIFASGGLFHLSGPVCEHIGAEHGFSDSYVEAIFIDHRGTLWAKTNSGALLFLPTGQSKFQKTFYKNTPSVGRVFIHEAPDGSIWLSDDFGMRRVSDKDGALLAPYPLNGTQNKDVRFGDFAFESDGSLWAATRDGVQRFDHINRWKSPQATANLPGECFTRDQGLSSNAVWRLFVDREGTIWVGTNSGLDHLRHSALTTLEFPHIQEHEFSIAPGEKGSVWIGNEAMPLTRVAADGTLTSFPGVNLPISLRRDHNGTIWSAGEGSSHLWRVDGNRFSSVRYPEEDKALVVAAAVDRNDELWISRVGPEIYHLSREVWSKQNRTLGRKPNVLGATAEDSHGNVWFAFSSQVVKWDGRDFHRFSFKGKGVSVSTIAIRGDHVWLGGEGGVQLLTEGQFHIMRWKNPELPGRVSGVVETASGLWTNGFSGITHVPPDELAKWVKNPDFAVSADYLNVLDGLPGLSAERYPEPSVVEGSDGRLWFATTEGVAWMYPYSLDRLRNRIPPPVSISSVASNGKIFANLNKLTLPPRVRNLEISYAALSLAVPERVLFRYRLDGVDDEWRQPGTRRQAFYNDLRPGNYRFQVIACNNDGIWNTNGAQLNFSIAPAWYQTTLFRLLLGVLAVSIAWSLHRLRLWRVAHTIQARFEDRLAERTRIARELHDTLLQSFHGVLFRCQAAKNMLPRRSEEAIQVLDCAITRAEEAIAEGRGAIQGLRPESAAACGLAQLLSSLGQELLSAEDGKSQPLPAEAADQRLGSCTNGLAGGAFAAVPGTNADRHSPAFRVAEEGERRTLSPILQDEVYGIARELVRNSFQHGDARQIEVEIRYDQGQLRVRIRDDGKGIDPKVLEEGGRAGHWGLPGIRERSKQIGARLGFWSKAGAGTEVELTVPASVAYVKASDGSGRRASGFRLFNRKTGTHAY